MHDALQQQHVVAGGDASFLPTFGGASLSMLQAPDSSSSSSTLLSQSYLPLRPLGHGATGVVFLALHFPSSCLFALKAFSTSSSLRLSLHEEKILSMLPPHPSLPALHASFQHHSFRFLVIDYCSGGDLNSLRLSQIDHKFSPEAIRFYAAEIVLALQHLHLHGVVYRDLKPENILLSHTGHVMLTDFDLSVALPPKTSSKMQVTEQPEVAIAGMRAFIGQSIRMTSRRRSSNGASVQSQATKVHKRSKSHRVLPVSASISIERSYSFVGTEEYVAPEIILGTGHEFAVDWWALGILLYELLYGKSPFKGSNSKQTFGNILNKEVEFYGPWNPLQDLIRRLLAKEAGDRLGSRYGADEVKVHSFFQGLQWDALQDVSRPPFIPAISDRDVFTETNNTFDLTAHLVKVDEARVEERARRIAAKLKGNG